MKIINRFSRYALWFVTLLFCGYGVSFAAKTTTPTAASSAKTTAQTQNIPVATPAQARFVQNFQNEDLNVQFRYEHGKLIGIRFMNTGSHPMQLSLLGDNYVLGSKDYVVINPPNLSELHVYKAPFVTPLSTVDFLLPQRFGKPLLYVFPTDSEDNFVSKSTQK